MANGAKRIKVATKTVREDNTGVDFTFEQNAGTLGFDLEKVNEDIRARLACHGAAQKIGDSYAGAAGDPVVAFQNAEAVLQNLYNGEWGAEREVGVAITVVIEAVLRVKQEAGLPVNREETTAKYTTGADGKSGKEWRDEAMANAKVAAMAKKVNAERADERAKTGLQSAQSTTEELQAL